MKSFFLIILMLISFSVNADDTIFSNKTLSNFFMNPKEDAPIIYPVELGKKMNLRGSNDLWYNVLDERTGLVGWVLKENYSKEKPQKKSEKQNYKQSFKIFKERVLEMSDSIKEAISIETFTDVKHLGGAAAVVVADDQWFNGRRHSNQAFQVYEIWKGLNQSPSFLSFRNSKDEEQFIVLSGPHRPRYLKSNKK
ncbi:MAG: hypothetical protein CMP34_02130 [Rickettsiales bacterium]|nr:hypothetical protein [Rickettsiales bacterium]